jgi:integrase
MAGFRPGEGGNMARTIRDANLETRTARSRLKARGKPYYRTIEPGLHLGYRKPLSGAGKWVVRQYEGEQAYVVETIATADDNSDADGVAVLDFKQAQEQARERMVDRAHHEAGKPRTILTVARAMAEYIKWLGNKGRPTKDAEYRSNAFIIPKLGDIEVASLTTKAIEDWHSDRAKEAPRLRTKAGEDQKYRKLGADEESKRQRRASANRTLTVLKAALNRAWREGKIAANGAWHRVEPFEGVDAARIRYLSVAESMRLVNASDPDFRPLVKAALQTGCRYSELARLTVADFNSDAGTIAVRQSKSGKSRHVVLTDEGITFFKEVCAGRAGSEIMLTKADGNAWEKSHQGRPMVDACMHAKISPPIGIHGLRHTWASHAVMNGVPLLVVAKNLGHSDTRMVEKHYGHLAPSYIVDAIRKGAPQFGFKPDDKVASITGAR